MRARHWVYGVVSLGVVGAGVLIIREAAGQDGEIWHAGPFIGGVLVAVGWVFTSELNIRHSRTQHTISLITQQAFDPHRLENRKTIRKSLPSFDTKLTKDMVNFDQEDNELLVAIDLELNFFEFLAAGVFRGNLDEQLLLETLRSRFCNFYEQCSEYVQHWNKKSSTTWKNVIALHKRWSKKKSSK